CRYRAFSDNCSNACMALFNQVSNCPVRPLPVVDHHTVKRIVIHGTVEQHDRHTRLAKLMQIPPIAPSILWIDDQPDGSLGTHEINVVLLALDIAHGVAE